MAFSTRIHLILSFPLHKDLHHIIGLIEQLVFLQSVKESPSVISSRSGLAVHLQNSRKSIEVTNRYQIGEQGGPAAGAALPYFWG